MVQLMTKKSVALGSLLPVTTVHISIFSLTQLPARLIKSETSTEATYQSRLFGKIYIERSNRNDLKMELVFTQPVILTKQVYS
jgi:hypothetical protein